MTDAQNTEDYIASIVKTQSKSIILQNYFQLSEIKAHGGTWQHSKVAKDNNKTARKLEEKRRR